MSDWQKMYNKLNALPPEQRRLAKGLAWDHRAGCGCVLGTLVNKEAWPPQRSSFKITLYRIATGIAPPGAREALAEFGLLRLSSIAAIESVNDAFKGTPEKRFEHVLAWLKRMAEKPVPPEKLNP